MVLGQAVQIWDCGLFHFWQPNVLKEMLAREIVISGPLRLTENDLTNLT